MLRVLLVFAFPKLRRKFYVSKEHRSFRTAWVKTGPPTMLVSASGFTESRHDDCFMANVRIYSVTFRAEGFPECTLGRSGALDADQPSELVSPRW
jgi:hypothetical protein